MIQRRRPSGFIEPCQPSKVARAPSGPLWVHELKQWQEWEIPSNADKTWPETAKTLLPQWREARISRQKEMDVSIAAKPCSSVFS
jgi:hypothetical protein